MTIKDNTIDDTSVAIYLGGEEWAKIYNANILNNAVTNARSSDLGGAIITERTYDSLVKGNTILDTPECPGIYNLQAHNIIFEDNYIGNTGFHGITFLNAYDCTIRSNTITDTGGSLIRFDYSSDGNTISHNTLTNGGMQIYPNNHNLQIIDNTFSNVWVAHEGGHNIIVENNFFLDNSAVEFHGYEGEEDSISFRYNFMKDCGYLLIGGNTMNSTFENNIFVNTGRDGTIFLGYEGGHRDTIAIKNNVFYSIQTNAIDFSRGTIDQVDIANNIFMDDDLRGRLVGPVRRTGR